jgi:acetylornithine/succinyldiaminopimelate/putrescine aminotransferase
MLNNITLSLTDLLGEEYIRAVKNCAVALMGQSPQEADRWADERVDFIDQKAADKADQLLEYVGKSYVEAFINHNSGAPTGSFLKAANNHAAPIGGIGYIRAGEDGRLYLVSKSEHYQTPFGHNFGAYRLIGNARRLGILNATHNNTRGFIVRLLEREIIRTINGLKRNEAEQLDSIVASTRPKVLNRVLNLETGSLACEAAIKMMLSRFYKLDATFPDRKYEKKTPVFFVMGDNEGGAQANYHGTTILAQTLRGLWPGFGAACGEQNLYKVVPVKINDIGDFRDKIQAYNQGAYKTAGFIHEIVLMNYGGIRLEEAYLRAAYALCAQYDTPTMADEIQSCMWYSDIYLFRHYGISPDFVILGKGCSGGEYPASKVVTTAEMDSLNQFGALVTNGQGELASLSYLLGMAFVEANGKEIDSMGSYAEALFKKLEGEHPQAVQKVEGKGHLLAVHFHRVDDAVKVVDALNAQCIDISAQTYKANCPPAALLKLPLIMSEKALNMLAQRVSATIASV